MLVMAVYFPILTLNLTIVLSYYPAIMGFSLMVVFIDSSLIISIDFIDLISDFLLCLSNLLLKPLLRLTHFLPQSTSIYFGHVSSIKRCNQKYEQALPRRSANSFCSIISQY
ncbi:MAG: hypothetical protein B7X50_09520 [Alishewanella sp. 34-51-39]|nr:MAG: hypothetical protein B7X50_09520 [Alishewanella sp. 34-51-39]